MCGARLADRALALTGPAPGRVRRARPGLELRAVRGHGGRPIGLRRRAGRFLARAEPDHAPEGGRAGPGRGGRHRPEGRRRQHADPRRRPAPRLQHRCRRIGLGGAPGVPGHRASGDDPRQRRDRPIRAAVRGRAGGPRGDRAGAYARQDPAARGSRPRARPQVGGMPVVDRAPVRRPADLDGDGGSGGRPRRDRGRQRAGGPRCDLRFVADGAGPGGHARLARLWSAASTCSSARRCSRSS